MRICHMFNNELILQFCLSMSIVNFHHKISPYICQYLVYFVHNFAQFKVTVPMFQLSTLSTLWPAPCHRKMMSIVSMHLELHNVPKVSIFSFLHIEMEIFFNISSNLVLLSAHEICLRYIIPRPLRPAHAQLQVTFKNSSDRTPLARYI